MDKTNREEVSLKARQTGRTHELRQSQFQADMLTIKGLMGYDYEGGMGREAIANENTDSIGVAFSDYSYHILTSLLRNGNLEKGIDVLRKWVDFENCYLSIRTRAKEDISHVARLLPNLSKLNCKHNNLNGLQEVKKLTKLTTLFCNYNSKLDSLQGIEELQLLTTLDCGNSNLATLSGVEHLHKLEEFSCQANQLTRLYEVQSLTNLTYLDCSINQLISLHGIEGLVNLTELNCSANGIKESEVDRILSILPDLEISY